MTTENKQDGNAWWASSSLIEKLEHLGCVDDTPWGKMLRKQVRELTENIENANAAFGVHPDPESNLEHEILRIRDESRELEKEVENQAEWAKHYLDRSEKAESELHETKQVLSDLMKEIIRRVPDWVP